MTVNTKSQTSHSAPISNLNESSKQSAAVRGASLAFGQPPVKPKPKINTYSGNNGALAAATKVGVTGVTRQSESNTPKSRTSSGWGIAKLEQQNTGKSVVASSVEGGSPLRGASRLRNSRLDNGGFLQAPTNTSVVEQNQSPSHIAATLAASRSASVSPNPTGQQLSTAQVRWSASSSNNTTSRTMALRDSTDHLPDTTPIPPTTSLIGMFEQNAKASPQVKRSPSTAGSNKPSTKSRPPPKRQEPSLSNQVQSLSHQASPSSSSEPQRARPKSQPQPILSPKPKNLKVVSPMRLRSQGSGGSGQPDPSKTTNSQKIPPRASSPIPIPDSGSRRSPNADTKASNSSNVSPNSAVDPRSSPSFRTALNSQSRQHLTSESALSVNSFQTIDSMANAIVASSLASSRAGSPSKHLQPPPPPPSRRTHHRLFHNEKEASRTPSPGKQASLRTTMRKPKADDDADEGDKRRSKKHIMKKHPNKHHEGDRKRWRDEITERERKRYEAVWASNRGVHVPSSYPGAEFCVCNLLVRDIFSRSRLHNDVLEEVYALVDRNLNGVLEKEEFVVGLWLIDQRLKGRKLPVKVSDHVWRSVGNLGGIKVRKAGR